jgi:hypothetical protein
MPTYNWTPHNPNISSFRDSSILHRCLDEADMYITFYVYLYCDMTPERLNSPLLDNGSPRINTGSRCNGYACRNQGVAAKLTHISMEVRIRGDWLGTERVYRVSGINKGFHEQTTNVFMETGDCIGGRADKNGDGWRGPTTYTKDRPVIPAREGPPRKTRP